MIMLQHKLNRHDHETTSEELTTLTFIPEDPVYPYRLEFHRVISLGNEEESLKNITI